MAKYIKKTDEIQAVQWNGVHSLAEMDKMLEGDWTFTVSSIEKKLKIHTTSDSGPLLLNQSDYLVLEGSSLKAIPQDIFKKLYEEARTVLNGSEGDIFIQWDKQVGQGMLPKAWISTTTKSGSAVNPKQDIYTISGYGVQSAQFKCDDCLDVSKDTVTFAQKTACHCCDSK